MDKYMENAMLRADLQNVLGRLSEVCEQVGTQDVYIDWELVRNAKETVTLVNKFYGFKGEKA